MDRKRYPMANMKEITATVLAQYPDATACRNGSNGNFLAVKGEVVDGVQTYYGVKVWALAAKATKTNPAFDVEAAHAEYEAHAAKQAEKASKPKKSKEPDPAKVEAKAKRQQALLDYMKDNPNVEMTSLEVFMALRDAYDGQTMMTVGSDLKALSTTEDVLTCEVKDGKKYWTYNA